eukprot:gene11104-3811_t
MKIDEEEFNKNNYILRNFSYIIKNKLAGCHKPGMSPSNLKNDLIVLKAQGITAIVSLSEAPLDEKIVKENGMKIIHFPVKDYYPPSREQMNEMVDFVDNHDGAVVIHCNAGQGRTGTMLAAYLIAKGESCEDVIPKLRKMRKGSIQTYKQEDGLKEFESFIKKK